MASRKAGSIIDRGAVPGTTKRKWLVRVFNGIDANTPVGVSFLRLSRDMNAKAERPANLDELHVMLQSLLAERLAQPLRCAFRHT